MLFYIVNARITPRLACRNFHKTFNKRTCSSDGSTYFNCNSCADAGRVQSSNHDSQRRAFEKPDNDAHGKSIRETIDRCNLCPNIASFGCAHIDTYTILDGNAYSWTIRNSISSSFRSFVLGTFHKAVQLTNLEM